jgi:hypothetical protein
MTSSGDIVQHTSSVKYAEEEVTAPDGSFSSKRITDEAGRDKGLTIAGPCPKCGGRTAADFSYGIGGTKGFRSGDRARPIPSPVTMYCECGHAHDDRPADAFDTGCGRYWDVIVPEDLRQPPAGQAKP